METKGKEEAPVVWLAAIQKLKPRDWREKRVLQHESEMREGGRKRNEKV